MPKALAKKNPVGRPSLKKSSQTVSKIVEVKKHDSFFSKAKCTVKTNVLSSGEYSWAISNDLIAGVKINFHITSVRSFKSESLALKAGLKFASENGFAKAKSI